MLLWCWCGWWIVLVWYGMAVDIVSSCFSSLSRLIVSSPLSLPFASISIPLSISHYRQYGFSVSCLLSSHLQYSVDSLSLSPYYLLLQLFPVSCCFCLLVSALINLAHVLFSSPNQYDVPLLCISSWHGTESYCM